MFSSKTFETKFENVINQFAHKFKKFSKIFQKSNLIEFKKHKQNKKNLNKFLKIYLLLRQFHKIFKISNEILRNFRNVQFCSALKNFE